MKALLPVSEVWCTVRDRVDEALTAACDPHRYGHPGEGAYALPKTLAILDANARSVVWRDTW